MPGKNKPNPFLFYMRAKKKEVEKRLGRNVRMDELPGILNNDWKALPAREKEHYIKMCDLARASSEKVDSRGIPLSKIEADEKKAENELSEMKTYIRSICSPGAIHNLSFYVIAMEYYMKTDEDGCLPAEVGIVKFSLKDGIVDEFHRIIKAECPKGSQLTIRDYSARTHNLFEYRENFVIKQVCIPKDCIIDDIYDYLNKDTELNQKILYADQEHMEVAKSVLQPDDSGIKIYSLDLLYMHLYDTPKDRTGIPLSISRDVLKSTLHDYNKYCACMYHQRFMPDNINFCALSEAKRWVYNMCNHFELPKRLGIKLIQDRHYPRMHDENVFKTVEIRSEVEAVSMEASFQPAWTHSRRNARTTERRQVQNNSNEEASGGEEINYLDQGFSRLSTTASNNFDDEFPSLTSSSQSDSDENNLRPSVWAPSAPRGVTYASVGLHGLGRGKTNARKK